MVGPWPLYCETDMSQHREGAVEKWFLVYIGGLAGSTHHTGPYDSEEAARAKVEDGREAGDKYVVVVGPIPTDNLPASGLITLT